jgi:hypothetical protein
MTATKAWLPSRNGSPHNYLSLRGTIRLPHISQHRSWRTITARCLHIIYPTAVTYKAVIFCLAAKFKSTQILQINHMGRDDQIWGMHGLQLLVARVLSKVLTGQFLLNQILEEVRGHGKCGEIGSASWRCGK